MATVVHDYLPENKRIAGLLVNTRFSEVVRLLDAPLEEDEEARLVYSPALLVTDTGRRWLVDTDESKSNMLLADASREDFFSGPWYGGFRLREPIATSSQSDPLHCMLTDAVTALDVISREPDPGVPDSNAMCGIRLRMSGGGLVCVGTYLTELRMQEVAFRLPSEVDPELHYHPQAPARRSA